MSRLIGLDPGEARIGVALSDPTGTIASPHGFIDVRASDVLESIRALVTDFDCSTVVVGLPLRLDGTEGPAAARSRSLGRTIGEALGVDIQFADERFTTVTAEQALLEGNVRRGKRKTARDPIAAAVMLQGYLDRQANDGGYRDHSDDG